LGGQLFPTWAADLAGIPSLAGRSEAVTLDLQASSAQALAEHGNRTLELVRRSDAERGLKLFPRRWVVGTHHPLAPPQPPPRQVPRGISRKLAPGSYRQRR
jgi:hypothetical protein